MDSRDARRTMGLRSAARFAGAGALALFLCWQHVQATRLGYRVEAARKQSQELRGRVAALRVEFDSRLSPQQVAARAVRLGLVPAAPAALRRLSQTPGAVPAVSLLRLWTRGLGPLVAAARS